MKYLDYSRIPGGADPPVGQDAPPRVPTGFMVPTRDFKVPARSKSSSPRKGAQNRAFALAVAALFIAPLIAPAQPTPPRATTNPPRVLNSTISGNPGGYASDVLIVREAQDQALEQAKEMLKQVENPRENAALQSAIREMERAKAMLELAQSSPEKLAEALPAQQAAYQALLKLMPREFQVSRSQNSGQGGGAGQPNPRELDQLEMAGEENRYETERQASPAPDSQQRARVQAADRLKQLAQRQQDLNQRLRELQTALQAARTEAQREDVRRELKRLQDEERRMLADLDELRQTLDQSPNAAASAETRQQIDQARSDVQRAAEDLGRESASQALASGTRAQESLRQAREDLRRRSSSQFSDQMRQLRSQARQLAGNEDELARNLESLANAEHKPLDDSAQRQEVVRQIARQQNALTNLLSSARAVTEQAENIEPLLAQQLYDALRRADQTRAENLLDSTAQLVDRGFVSQAGEAERAARESIQHLREGIERAADSVLGNEADSLRYAQNELEHLTDQVEQEIARSRTNGIPSSEGEEPGTNSVARAASPSQTNAGQAGRESEGAQGENAEAAGADSARNAAGPRSGAEVGRAGGDSQEQAGNSSSPQGGSASGTGQRAQPAGSNPGGTGADRERLRQLVEQLGGANTRAGPESGPITGNSFVRWSDRMREVEEVLDSADLRNQLASVRERVSAFRGYYRDSGQVPQGEAIREQILAPMTQVRVWLRQELGRLDNARSLIPLDRDPVPEHFSELVRRYYEKLGSGQPEGAAKGLQP